MKIINKISPYNGNKKHTSSEKNGTKCSTNSCLNTFRKKALPAFAWKANMVPFCSSKKSSYKYQPRTIAVSEFKEKMNTKLDKISEGTYTPPKTESKEALLAMKSEALKTVTGPLELQSKEIEPGILKVINKQLSKVKNIDDLLKILNNKNVPALVPMVITQPATENYKNFMAEVHRGNATKNVPQAVAIAREALDAMQGEEITIPRFELKVSRKGLATGLLEHLKAGGEYEAMSIMTSPHIEFFSEGKREQLGGLPKDELSVDIIQPVFER